jgi:hypothetical protein
MNDAAIAVLCVSLAVATFLWIFAVRSDGSDNVPHRTRLDQLMDRRDAIYENLRDLRFEHRAGKFSEKDYEETKRLLEVEAARVLVEMDSLTGGVPTPATRQAATQRQRP